MSITSVYVYRVKHKHKLRPMSLKLKFITLESNCGILLTVEYFKFTQNT